MSAARGPFDTPPAPVVTEYGIFGTLPPPLAARAVPPRSRRMRLAAVGLALVAALWLLALAAAHITSRAVAIPALERTIAALADVDALLLLHEPELRAAGAQAQPGAAVTVPGFPVPAATLTAEQARSGSRAQWRDALLAAAAEATYRSGMDAFAPDGVATDGGLFSTSGGVRRVIEGLSASRHRLAAIATWVAGLGALALTMVVLASGGGVRRLAAIGLALIVAAALTALAGLTATFLVLVVGHDQSQLASEVSAIARTLAWTPLREAKPVAIAGLAIAAPALLAGLARNRGRMGR